MASVKRSNQKNLLYLIVGIIVLVGIGGAVYLSQQTQIFKSRASYGGGELTATCTGGNLAMRWSDTNAISYKVRGAVDLLSRPDNNTWNSISGSKKIIVNDLRNCDRGLCYYSTTERATGEPIRSGEMYYVWVHPVYNYYGTIRTGDPIETFVNCN